MPWQDAPIVETSRDAASSQPAASSNWQSAPLTDESKLGLAVELDRAGAMYDRTSDLNLGYGDAQRQEAETRFRQLQAMANANGVQRQRGIADQVERAITRNQFEGNMDRMDTALGTPGQYRTDQVTGQLNQNNDYTSLPIAQAPGAMQLLEEQQAWFADPANRGKMPPERILHVMRDEAGPGRVKVSPQFGQMLLTNLQTTVGTPNPADSGLRGLVTGNDVEIQTDLANRQRRLNELGGTPYALLPGPETGRQFADQLMQPGAQELDLATGARNAFVAGSNRLGADLVGGGLQLIGADKLGKGIQENLEGVAASYPGSASAQGFNPMSARWWTEGLAAQAPSFALVALPGMGAAKALQGMGATVRAQQLAGRVAAFGSSATVEATAAYTDVYRRLRADGASEEDARAFALTESAIVGTINGALDSLSFGELFLADHEMMGALQRAARGFLVEGGTEGLQEWIPMATASLVERGAIDPLQAPQVMQLLSASVLGGFMGGGVSVANGGGGQAVDNSQGPMMRPDATDALLQRLRDRNGGVPLVEQPGEVVQPPAPVEPELLPPGGPAPAPGVETGPPAGEPDWDAATFEDGATLADPALVDQLLERLRARQAEQIGQTPPGGTPELEPTAPIPTAPEPDFEGATFEDVTPEQAAEAQRLLERPDSNAGASEGSTTSTESSALPFEAGQAWGTVHDTAKNARVVGERLAKASGNAVYLVPDGAGYRLDRRRPANGGIAITPDGVGTAANPVDSGMRRRQGEDAGTADARNQMGLFVAPGEIIGERPGQTSMFGDTPGSKPKPAAPTAEDKLREEARAATVPMFEERKPHHQKTEETKLRNAMMEGAMIVRAGTKKGEAGKQLVKQVARQRMELATMLAGSETADPRDMRWTPRAVDLLTSHLTQHVVGLQNRRDKHKAQAKKGEPFPVMDVELLARDAGVDVETARELVGPLLKLKRFTMDQASAQAREVVEEALATGRLLRDGQRNEPTAGERSTSNPTGETAGQGPATAGAPRGDRSTEAVGGSQGSEGIPTEGTGLAPTEGRRAGGGAPGSGREGGNADRPATRRTPGQPDESVPDAIGTESRPRRGSGQGDAGRAGGSSAGGPGSGREAGPDSGGEVRNPIGPVPGEKPSEVAKQYQRRRLARALFEEVRQEVDRIQGEFEAQLAPYARPYQFKSLPTELSEALEGHPLRLRIMRSMIRISPEGGEGMDAMSELGVDRYVQRLEYLAGSPIKHGLEITRNGDARQQFLTALVDLQSSTGGDAKLPGMWHVDPVKMPPGTTFTVMGFPFKVIEPEEGELMLTSDALADDLPLDQLGVIPIDQDSAKPPKAVDISTIEFNTQIRELPASQEDAIEAMDSAHSRNKKVHPSMRIKVAPLDGGNTKTLKQIIDDFAKSLDSQVRVGTRGRKVGGTYWTFSQRVEIKKAGSIDVVAHEFGHWLDDTFGVMGQWSGDDVSPFDAELIPMFSAFGSQGPTKTYERAEGVAEWFRAYMVNPAAAAKAAPKFYAHVRAKLPAEVWAKVDAYSDDVRRWAGSSATAKTLANMRSELQPEHVPLLKRIKDAFNFDALKTELVDDKWPFVKAVRAAKFLRTSPNELAPRNDPELLARLLAGEDSIVQDAIENGTPVAFSFGDRAPGVEGGINWMLAPLANTTKAGDVEALTTEVGNGIAFMVNEQFLARAAKWRKEAQGEIALLMKNPFLSPKDAAKLIKAITDRVEMRIARMIGTGAGVLNDNEVALRSMAELVKDEAKLAGYQEFAKRYRAHARGLLQYMVDKGRMKQAAMDEIVANNETYTDMHRIVDDFDGTQRVKAIGKKLGTSSKVIHQFKGSTLEIGNPIVNLMDQTARVLHETDTNYVRQQFNRMLVAMTVDEDSGKLRPRGLYEGVPINFDEIGSKVSGAGKHTITTYDRGTAERWQYRADVYDVMNRLSGMPELGPVANLASFLVKGLPQTLITQSPDFVIRQLFKDAQQRAIVSNFDSGVSAAFKPIRADTVEKMKQTGATQAGLYIFDESWPQRMRRAIREVAGEKNSKIIHPRELWRLWTNTTAYLGDTRARAAEFQAAYDQLRADGMDAADAYLKAGGEARGLIDYAVAGRMIRAASPFVLFLNPAIQGPIRTARAFKARPMATALKFGSIILGGRVIMAILRKLFDQEDEYQKLPAWRKDFFLNFKVGPWWLSIPQPYELGVFGSIAERMLAHARGYDRPYKGVGGSLASALLPVSDMPVGGLARTYIENRANHSFFFGSPIVDEYDAGKRLELRQNMGRASNLGKLVSGAAELPGLKQLLATLGVDTDPRHADNLITNMGGGAGRLLMQLSNVLRPDRDGIVGPFRSTTGIFREPALYDQRDVRGAFQLATELGVEQSKGVRQLAAMLREADHADAGAEKERLRKDATDYAAELLKQLEADEADLLERGRQRAELRNAARE